MLAFARSTASLNPSTATLTMRDSESITITLAPGDAPIVVVPRTLGPVRLIHELGRGAMGVVWLGRHDLLARDVAVKFLLRSKPDPDDFGFGALMAEARNASAVRHPGLVSVLHADIFESTPYFIMDLIDGPTLSTLLARSGPLPEPAVLEMLEVVCNALGELHNRELVHCDVKPSNTLFDSFGRPFVSDFGLARTRTPPGESAAEAAGTPAYMAPESFEGTFTPRSDVYALALTAYQALTGLPPFRGSLADVIHQHRHAPLPTEPIHDKGISRELIEVLERAAHKNPLYRYKTARQLLQAIHVACRADGSQLSQGLLLAKLVRQHQDVPIASRATQPLALPSRSSYHDDIAELASRQRQSRHRRVGEDEARSTQTLSPFVDAPAADGPDALSGKRGAVGVLTDIAFDCSSGPFEAATSYIAAAWIGLLVFVVIVGLFTVDASLVYRSLASRGALPTLSVVCVACVVFAAGKLSRRQLSHRAATATIAKHHCDDAGTWIERALGGRRTIPIRTLVRYFIRRAADSGFRDTTIRIAARHCLKPQVPLAMPIQPMCVDDPTVSWETASSSSSRLHQRRGRRVGARRREPVRVRSLWTTRANLLSASARAIRDTLGGAVLLLFAILALSAFVFVASLLFGVRIGEAGVMLSIRGTGLPASPILNGRFIGWVVPPLVCVLSAAGMSAYFLKPRLLRVWLRIRSGSQWFAVPGGIVVRAASIRESKWRVRLFARRDCVLCVFLRRRNVWHVSVGNTGSFAERECTSEQLDFILSAWLSPLMPPSPTDLI